MSARRPAVEPGPFDVRRPGEPAPIYRLLLPAALTSTRLSGEIAVEATRALLLLGWRVVGRSQSARVSPPT